MSPRRPSAPKVSNGFDHPALNYRPPKLLRRVNAAAVLALSTLLVCGLWTLIWFASMSYAKATLTDWADAQAARGAIVDYAEIETGGYPTRIELTLNAPHYAGPLPVAGLEGDGVPVSWRGERLTLSTRPWMPWRFTLGAPGKHTFEIGTAPRTFSGTVRALTVELNPGDGWPEHLRLDLQGLTLGGTAPVGAADLTLDFTHDAHVEAGGVSVRLDVEGRDVTLPMADRGLGTTLKSLDARLAVTGPMGPGSLKPRLEAWRSVGGALEVETLKLRLDQLALAATGTLALDENHQPTGAFTAKFEGLFQALEVLRAQGLVGDADAVVATMGLAALSRRSSDGGAPSINLAVSIQDGWVSLGAFKVLKLPDLGLAPATRPEPQPEPSEPERDYKDIPPVI